MSRHILLIDGEHYPPVVARAVQGLRSLSREPTLALLVGGGEKVDGEVEIGVEVLDVRSDPEGGLMRALEDTDADSVFDLSDEPILGYVARMRMVSIALFKGVAYEGPGFRFDPPPRPRLAKAPSVGVIGTGKRTGKTAVGATAARIFDKAGFDPVIIAMGRGGPPEPQLIDDPDILDPEHLLEIVKRGEHAASDYIEDAIMARVRTVGAWRAGGGLAGTPGFSNFDQAIEMANGLTPGMLVMEGSGAAIPPAHFDAGVLVVNANIDPAHLRGYLGLYRMLLADLIVLTMCEEPLDPERIQAIEQSIPDTSQATPPVIRTVFRPHPLGSLENKKVWFATTAPQDASDTLKDHLEQEHGAKVITICHSLSDRPRLQQKLKDMEDVEVVAVEVKAAAVDLVTREALKRGLEVVYVDNRMVATNDQDIEAAFLEVADLAQTRFG